MSAQNTRAITTVAVHRELSATRCTVDECLRVKCELIVYTIKVHIY